MQSEDYEDTWLNIEANWENLIFDDANELMEEMCAKYKPEEWSYLKHHANSWGFSSNQFFADNIIGKMTKL